MSNKFVLVGNPEETHVGAHFFQSAKELELQVRFCDVRKTFHSSKFITRVNWHLRGHYPTFLRKFSKEIITTCQNFRPNTMLSIGLAPVESWALIEIGKLGIQRLNYLTDDPWNPAHRAPWFMKALVMYDYIFSPRRSNMSDLKQLGCRNVLYLPFAYSPRLHFPEQSPMSKGEMPKVDWDVAFIGGADRDRIPYISAIIKAGFRLSLYGSYWERFRQAKGYMRGYANPGTLRKVISRTKVALCLLRKANRDGHSMRSFEIPAIGACMLTEDTLEHREIFGKEGENVFYFKDIDELVKKTKFLLDNSVERNRLANNVRTLIVNGNHTYKDRLLTILKVLREGQS